MPKTIVKSSEIPNTPKMSYGYASKYMYAPSHVCIYVCMLVTRYLHTCLLTYIGLHYFLNEVLTPNSMLTTFTVEWK